MECMSAIILETLCSKLLAQVRYEQTFYISMDRLDTVAVSSSSLTLYNVDIQEKKEFVEARR